jgi:Domain of unknown function (DUF4249)
MKIIASFIIVLLAITACEKKVEVNIPYDGDKLVLNSLFIADSNLYARVFVSKKVTSSNNFSSPASALLTLFENNVSVGNFSAVTIFGTQYYKSPVTAKAGKSYKIIAASPTYTTVDGVDSVPQVAQVQIQSVSIINTANNTVSDFDRKIKFILNDDATKEDFYLIKIFAADTNRTSTGPRFIFTNGTQYGFSCEIEGLNTNPISALNNFGEQEVFITDETFNGKNITLTANFDQYGGSYSHYALEVTSLSKSTYRYLKSVLLQQNTNGDPFAEASIVYSNITNGFGIVGGANKKISFVKKI